MAAATPIIIETPGAQITVLETRIDPLVLRADSIVIQTQDAYESAAGFLRDCKTMQKDIADTMDPACSKAHEAHKAVTSIRSKLLDPISKAEKLVKGKMAGFVELQERRAREERIRIEAEARKAEEDRRLREAAELEAQGDAEEAERVISAPIIVPAVKEAPKVTAEGTSTRKKYSAKLVDLNALVKAAAEGRIQSGLVIANMTALNALAAALGEGFSVPGVELQVETIIAAKGR